MLSRKRKQVIVFSRFQRVTLWVGREGSLRTIRKNRIVQNNRRRYFVDRLFGFTRHNPNASQIRETCCVPRWQRFAIYRFTLSSVGRPSSSLEIAYAVSPCDSAAEATESRIQSFGSISKSTLRDSSCCIRPLNLRQFQRDTNR